MEHIIQANFEVGKIANKIAKCKEKNLHILVEAFQSVRFIWLAVNRIMKDSNNDKQRKILSKLIEDLKHLYLIIRKRISYIYDLSNHYYYAV